MRNFGDVVFVDFDDEAHLVHGLNDGFAGFLDCQAGKATGDFGHATVFADDLDDPEMMALTDFPVVEVVRGGNLDNTGAEAHVDHFVSDDFYLKRPIDAFDGDGLADVLLVTLVVRVDGDGGITEFGLGASRGESERTVLDVIERGFLFFVVDFDVGESGLVVRAEIDQFFATIDHTIVPHFFESRVDAGDDVFVESESEVGPSTRGAERADLELHVATLLLDEVPDARIELVAVKIEARMAFFF